MDAASAAPNTRARAWHALAWIAAAAVLTGVFAWYLQPQFVIELATRLIACF